MTPRACSARRRDDSLPAPAQGRIRGDAAGADRSERGAQRPVFEGQALDMTKVEEDLRTLWKMGSFDDVSRGGGGKERRRRFDLRRA